MLGVDAMRAIRDYEFQTRRVYPMISRLNLVARKGRDYLVTAEVDGRFRSYTISGAAGKYTAKKTG